ncbi:hypothetical protein MBAV_006029 [Candidatus Magnetobacterium bavaricum]|uniref:Tetratricopeptide repeat protein n=1 Tax=Candidatus Magnetobacterium bavaricum TaxID=29290 RepID=A0A0F3GIN0_9BACT|nr:hypothetical protein MBAV_006029 [Candidatus Magnetobacterium bavaricum]
MRGNKLNVVRAWFQKAENDLITAEHTMNKFLATGFDLTLVERDDLSRGEFVYWVTPVIRENMWHKLLSDEMSEMHTHAYQWYSDWISKAAKPNYKYLEEAVSHALEVGNIRGACPHARELGRYFDEMVLYREGRAIMETVAVRVSDAVIAETKATKDVAVGNFLHTYAGSLEKLGDSKQAIAYHEKALTIKLEVYGERHPSVATVRGNMAAVSDKSGYPQKAAESAAKTKTVWS